MSNWKDDMVIDLGKFRRCVTIGLMAAVLGVGGAAGVMAQDDISAMDDFSPEGCWSEDELIEPDTGAGNVVLYPKWDSPPEMVIDEDATYYAIMSTNKGDMIFELNTEAAPATVNNFMCLATNDFYDVSPFHRVIAGFMIQGGDPTGIGSGGPGYTFDDELPGDDLGYDKGTLAMANAGPDTQGSQFFIVNQDLTDEQLQKNYTIFGQLVDGENVLDDISDSAVVANRSGEVSRPVELLVIKDITIKVAS